MLLDNLKTFQKTKLRVLRKIAPVAEARIFLLDQLEFLFKQPKVNQLTVPPLRSSRISSDFCPPTPTIAEFQPTIEKQGVEDLTEWLGAQLFQPQVEVFSLRLECAGTAGKSFVKVPEPAIQAALFPTGEKCIHGMEKNYCSICLKRQREQMEPSAISNVFDLILPILQPPFGENFDSPIAFPSELYPFQRAGVKFLVEHEKALLADEMGLGKSIQAITAARCLIRAGKMSCGLILSPKSVLTDWEKKLWDWAPEIRVVKVRGTRDQRTLQWDTRAHIYLTTYETLRQDLSGSLEESDGEQDVARRTFDFVIFDEIQKLKNPDAGVAEAASLIESRIRWGLSGTPLENRLEELISVFAHINPDVLKGRDTAHPWMVRDAIKPHFLRRRKADVLPDLPKKLHDEVWLELTPAQRETYDRAEREGVVALDAQGDQVTVQHVLALITKLKQICNMDPVSQESCKLEFLTERLEEISEQGDKALVFSQYPRKTLDALLPRLHGFDPLVFDGSLSDSERDGIVQAFEGHEANKVLLMSVKAGGLGLTLTRANYVYHFDLWWNPAVAAQAEDRAHRIGQKKTVFVTSLLAASTIEERIQRLLESKRELFQQFMDDLSDTNLSNMLTKGELLSLFDLGKSSDDAGGKHVTGSTDKRTLAGVSPSEFERLVADLYCSMGFQAKLTPATRDGGVDIYAKHLTEAGTESLAIQCKHYPNGSVGVEDARALYGVVQAEPSITKGVLVTSGQFSKSCKDFAEGKRIELIDQNRLDDLLKKHNLI